MKKIDTFLFRFISTFLCLTLLYGGLQGKAWTDEKMFFFIAVFSNMFALIPLASFTRNEKKNKGKKQKVYSGLAYGWLSGILSYWVMHKFGIANDYVVIAVFIIAFLVAYIYEIKTVFITGCLLTYLLINIFFFIEDSGTFTDRLYNIVALKSIEQILSIGWWLMALVGYIMAKPPQIKRPTLVKKQRTYNKKKLENTVPKNEEKDLDKPMFRKPKEKLRHYVNK